MSRSLGDHVQIVMKSEIALLVVPSAAISRLPALRLDGRRKEPPSLGQRISGRGLVQKRQRQTSRAPRSRSRLEIG